MALQSVVDDLARRLGRPIAVEDRRWNLLAYSAHVVEPDRARRDSILRRSPTAEVVEYLESLNLSSATRPTEVPPIDELQMAARTCLTLRSHGHVLGYLWIVNGERGLDAAELAVAAEAADQAAASIWSDRLMDSGQRQRRAELLRALLRGGDLVEAAIAATDELGWPRHVRCAVALVAAPSDVSFRAERHWQFGEMLTGSWFGATAIVAPLGLHAASADLAAAVRAAGAEHIAVGGVVESLAGVPDSLRQAKTALLVSEADPGSGGSVTYEDLQPGWRQVAELWQQAGEPPAPPFIGALERHRQAPELLATLEAYVESDHDLTAVAAQLHVHRASLYRRIARIEEITKLDLGTSDGRLAAQTGLRMWRLSSASRPI